MNSKKWGWKIWRNWSTNKGTSESTATGGGQCQAAGGDECNLQGQLSIESLADQHSMALVALGEVLVDALGSVVA